MVEKPRMAGLVAFTVVCVGQVFSLLGTAMTGFALAIWAWEKTQQATVLSLVAFFSFAPVVLVSPFAGALVDRWNRKFVMILADLAAGMSTVAVLLLFVSGNLQIWHLYVANAFAAAFQAFHFPAYSAAVTTMVSKEHYGRASGMLSLAQNLSGVLAPVFAALLLPFIGLPGVLSIDIITFSVAVLLVLLVHIPKPPVSEAGIKSQGSIWKESIFGFRYILARRSLLSILLVFFTFNMIATFATTLMAPMILARTNDNVIVLGSVQSAAGVGGVVGGLAMSIWGGPKRRIRGLLGGTTVVGVGIAMLGVGQSPIAWIFASFFTLLVIPTVNGCSQAIWQSKVAPDVQGRVFATRLLIAQVSSPASMLLAGPLADRFFEPSMMASGSLSRMFGPMVGIGRGAGMGLMFVISGILCTIASFVAYSLRIVREAEIILPDFDSGASHAPEPLTNP
jgi:DHA3 family macrolide efflux protein-like MFS transporter